MSLPKPSNPFLNRETRNAVFAAIAIMALAFLNVSLVLTSSQSRNLAVVLEVAALIGLLVMSIASAVQSYHGHVEKSVWGLIISIVVVTFIRAILRQSIGLPFGILTALLVSVISSLTLPLQKADRGILFGYIASGIIIIFDAYADLFINRLSSSPDMINAATNLAALIFVIQIVILITQSRTLDLSTKIANAISVITLVVTILSGALSLNIIKNSMLVNQEHVILGTAVPLIIGLRRGIIVLGAIITAVASLLGVIIARSLARPLNRLTETSTQIAQGNLAARVTVDREDEFGQLGLAFNSMANELSLVVGQLETRVAERTSDLERRAVQIQTAAEIGKSAAQLRNLDELLTQAAQLISERFGFYHTGIFLLDERNEYAVLRASNSTGGQRMLARGHRLKVGEVGIVGHATGTGNPRIALDTGKDAVFFDNPDLPETRSEMALPLIAAGEVLGALDVQSTQESAFSQADISTLQVLADQVAIAIENARLFEQSQRALESVRRAYGDLSQTAWQKLQRASGTIGYISLAQGSMIPVAKNSQPVNTTNEQASTTADGMTLMAPLKIRDQVIGSIRLSKPDHSTPWTPDEIAVANALTEQLNSALESARLYQDAQNRAAKERTIGEISAKIGGLVDIDNILQTTIQELGNNMPNTEIAIQFK